MTSNYTAFPCPIPLEDMVAVQAAHDLRSTPHPAVHQRGDETQAAPFDFQGDPVRVMVGQDGEPWFIAKDVCAVLELAGSPAQHVRRLDEDEQGVITIHTPGGQQEMLTTSEADLYQLVFTSRKPEAKDFTRWVKREVLPAIRKHGTYMTPEVLEQAILSPDFVIGLATKLKEERAWTRRLRRKRSVWRL